MKKLYTVVVILLAIFSGNPSAQAQCAVDLLTNSTIYGFNAPGTSAIFTDFLCGAIDSVGTRGVQGYYDGDGYSINLVGGSQVTFEVTQCTGSPVSLTINDSTLAIIPGAYSAAACPNSLNFTATYTGQYVIVMNLNGACSGGGTSLLGEVAVKIQQGTQLPACPILANIVNDTICGALPLTLDGPFRSDNTTNSYPIDPIDPSLIDFTCSTPNNTMWYSYSPANNVDTVYAIYVSQPGGSFHGWLGLFLAVDAASPCIGGITYVDCKEGANDGAAIDTVTIPFTGFLGGNTYYFMIDGFQNSTGPFSIALQSVGIFTSIQNEKVKNQIRIYPNPAESEITILNTSTLLNEANVTISNTLGQIVMTKVFHNFREERIDVSSLSRGIYTVSVRNQNVNSTQRLVIEK